MHWVIILLILVQVYCGFIQDAFISLTPSDISGFSNNRNDPRFMIGNYSTMPYLSLVCAINDNRIWLLKNTSGTPYYWVVERSNHQSTFSERSFFLNYPTSDYYDENLTTVLGQLDSSYRKISLGEQSNQYFAMNWNGSNTIFKMLYIHNNTKKWTYTVTNFLCMSYDLQNSNVLAVFKPAVADGTILLEVRNINNSLSILNSQHILCSNPNFALVEGNKQYFGVFNGSHMLIFNYSQNCPPIWSANVGIVRNFDFCGPWFFYSSKTVIYQHYANNGTFIASFQTAYKYPQVKLLEINSICSTNIFQYHKGTILRTSLDNTTGTFVQNQTVTSYVDFINYTSLIISSPTFMNNSTITINSNRSFQINILALSFILIGIIVNSFRMRDFVRIYFIVNQLGFHNYHNVNYTGMVKNILDYMNYIQTNIWKLTHSQQIIQKIQDVYTLSSYTNYTNPKFLEVEGRDSMFFENTKDYLLLSVPVSLFSFIVFHYIYKALSLFHLRIKTMFSSYSLAYGIFLILFVQNLSRLSFLACHNFMSLFFFSTEFYIMQGVTIIFVGFITILSMSFFYMMKYLYGKKIKYLSFNLKKVSWWPTTLLISCVLRPIIQVACNVFMFQSYNFVILSVFIIEFSIVIILAGVQILNRSFKKKMEFVLQSSENFMLGLLNFTIYLKYYAYPELGQLFQLWIQHILYLLMALFLIEALIFIAQIANLIKRVAKRDTFIKEKKVKTDRKQNQQKISQKNEDNNISNQPNFNKKDKTIRKITLLKIQQL